MTNLSFGLIIGVGLISVGFLLYIFVLLLIQLKIINRLTETNKQLLIVVAGQNQKPEALRALVASNKPPQKVLKGIANGKKDKRDKPKNTDFTMEVGVR